MRPQVIALTAMLAASAVLLSACPRPNGYQGVRAYPQIPPGRLMALQQIPGEPGSALVALQEGLIQRVNLADTAAPPTPFLDVRDRIIPQRQTEEGLLGLALAPDYATSGTFYVYYTRGDPRHNRVSRFTAHDGTADAGSEQIVLDLPEKQFRNHNGGALAFGHDGDLYVAVGDGGGTGDPNGNGQNTNSLFGKILRIDVSGDTYTIPPDNPFAHGGGAPEVYAYGLRNPWRITFDTATGQLWAGDAGQDAWEEVDRIVKGGNYGWNTREGDHCYQPAQGCAAVGLPPRAEYSHDFGCAVIGGYVYRGQSMPELQGWYVYADTCSGRVWAVDASKDAGAAIPIAEMGPDIFGFSQDATGEIFVLSFQEGVLRLARKE